MIMKNERASLSPRRAVTLLTIASAITMTIGCGTPQPEVLEWPGLKQAVRADRATIRRDVDPISGPLTLDEAIARALKFNLERRTRLMEESIALQQLDLTRLDMLPKLVADAGYHTRSDQRPSYSSPYSPVAGPKSTGSSVSKEATNNTLDLGLTWSVLDAFVGYSSSKDQANRVLIATEKRRKAMHALMQDVRTAYWRAASAQALKDDVERTIALAEEALSDSRRVETERLRNPLDALRYQRQLLESLRLLEAIAQELSTAQVELASLINAPMGEPLRIAETATQSIAENVLNLPLDQLEEIALENNPDLREQHYNSRIARDQVRKTIARLFPNLTFSYGLKYDSDNYLVNNNWNEAGLQLSFNLFNVVTGPNQIKLAEAGVALADQRRVATQMAVVTQVHLARLQFAYARHQFTRADAIYNTDQRIAEQVRNRRAVEAQSKLDRVANDTATILSMLRRYQALAQALSAENRLLATLGLEPKIGSTSQLSLEELTAQIRGNGNPWAGLQQTLAAQ